MAIIYVKSGSTGNGSAWNNAYGSLVSALTAAQSSDEIWVAAGTYKPTTGTDRTASFTLKNNVGIYGGFAGTETARNQRNIATNVTILSGEIGAINNTADNSIHVVTADNTTNTTILDGFTITRGNGNSFGANQGGGGGVVILNSSPILRNIIFENNLGIFGSAFAQNYNSNATLTNIIFRNNSAISGGGYNGNGGAIYNERSNLTLTDVTFINNTSTVFGGAISNSSGANINLINTTFSNNNATNNGGAIYNSNTASSGTGAAPSSSNITLINTTFNNNTSPSGGAIYNTGSTSNVINSTFTRNTGNSGSVINSASGTSNVRNSIIWGNSGTALSGVNTVTNSIVQGGFTGTGNLNVDPLFIDAINNNLRLQSNSPAINVGNNSFLPADTSDLDKDGNTTETIPFDLAGNPRVNGTNVDLGAYEFVSVQNRPPVVNDAIFSISKTSPNGTVVGTINATDPDNNPLTYSITAGNPDTDGDTIKAFAISNTGVITVTDTNDVSAQTNPFNLTIQASDGTLNGTGIATINLNNVNPLSFQLKLYEDNNGTVGNEITGNNPILGNSFFAEILVGDIRTNAVGLITNSLDFGFAADVAQNINNFADISNVNSPLITSNFPLFRGGTLDNTNGLIDNLSGGAVPEASQGTAIGVNQLNRFSLLRFNVVGTRDNSNLTVTFDPSQIGFADGTFADPNGTLSLTRNIIINDAPIVGTINNVNLAERSAAGTVVVAGNLVEATDDNYGQTPTFSLSTSPKDGSGNNLFAINATTGEITLTQAGANTIDYESGVISYQLGVKATDGYKLSTEKTFNVNITNVNEGTIVVDKTAVTFGTKLSQYRTGATDSLFVRPNFADKTQYIDITNTASGTNDVLAIAGITINAQNVTTDANFANGDILLNPGQTRRIALTYTPKASRENFNLANGLVINSNAQNNSALNIQLTGKSTFNSDISYDGRVNLTDLTTLQRPGLFGSISGQTNYDPTADITGDGRINLAELVPFNSEFGLVV